MDSKHTTTSTIKHTTTSTEKQEIIKQYTMVKNKIRPLDLLLFKGTNEGKFSHVGMVVTKEILPGIKNLDKTKLYIYEITFSGDIFGHKDEINDVDNNVDNKGHFGVQIRGLERVVLSYSKKGRIAWCPLKKNPLDKSNNKRKKNLKRIKQQMTQIYSQYLDMDYESNAFELFGTFVPQLRNIRDKINVKRAKSNSHFRILESTPEIFKKFVGRVDLISLGLEILPVILPVVVPIIAPIPLIIPVGPVPIIVGVIPVAIPIPLSIIKAIPINESIKMIKAMPVPKSISEPISNLVKNNVSKAVPKSVSEPISDLVKNNAIKHVATKLKNKVIRPKDNNQRAALIEKGKRKNVCCSELIAIIYRELGIFPENIEPSNIMPADFYAGRDNLPIIIKDPIYIIPDSPYTRMLKNN